MRFRKDNTEGYTQKQLDELNDRFAAALAERELDADEADGSVLDHIAETVQGDFDDELAAPARAMTIAIYAQQTGRAGTICRDEDLIERQSADVDIYTGTPTELLDLARDMDKNPAGSHLRRVAAAIREELA